MIDKLGTRQEKIPSDDLFRIHRTRQYRSVVAL